MAKINKILNSVSNIGNVASGVINKVGGLFTSDDYTPSSIRDKYTNGFFGDTTHFTPNVFARFFDEPTYLTFRIKFNFGSNVRNQPDSALNFYSLDYLPEPLLSMPESAEKIGIDYSAYYYLKNTLGEAKRAAMLLQLINEIKDIQDNYPYYFTEISGLTNLSNVDTTNGVRLKDDAIIKIKCYDGLDLKITQWMQMYRKIAWDDVYQRWILPDMMRFFNVQIYVSEMRLFHSVSKSLLSPKYGKLYNFTGGKENSLNATSQDQLGTGTFFSSVGGVLNAASAVSSRMLGDNSTVTNVLNTVNQIGDTVSGVVGSLTDSVVRLCNNAINNFMPTICYDCHMCQFLIDNTLGAIDTLKSSKPEVHSAEIKIQVGQVLETQSYPLNVSLEPSNDKSYTPKADSSYFASFYINDEMLMREATYKKETLDSSKYKDTGITRTSNRMNDKLDYTDESADSYQIFNSNTALSANSLITAICNKLQKSDVLSTATNTSSEDMKTVTAQLSQGTAGPDSDDMITELFVSLDKPETKPQNEPDINNPLVVFDDILSTATDISNETRKQIADLFSQHTAEEISTATNVIEEIKNQIENNKQIEDLSQINEISDAFKENIMKSILTEITQADDAESNGALVKLAQIALNNSTEISPATSDENRSKLTGFSLLN